MSIETRNIVKLFGNQRALDEVSFTIKKGELVGFLGPNGAGKSTMMKIITGFLSPDSGTVMVNGEDIRKKDSQFRYHLGYLPENNPLYGDLYVREHLEITAGLYRLKHIRKKVAEIIDLTGLGDEQHKKAGALSKGYRQRVGLAQALIHDPSVLILDEPTTGLDPNQLDEIRALIREVSREKTVMFSSHIMQEVEAVCNRVMIINKGKIIADGSISGLSGNHIKPNRRIIAEFREPLDAEQFLSIKGIKNIQQSGNIWEFESDGQEDLRPLVFEFARDNRYTLLTLFEQKENLEEIFHTLTKKENTL